MEKEEIIKKIMEDIESKNNVKAVFGEPIKDGEHIIVPVAKIRSMGGIGSGEGQEYKEGKKGTGFGIGFNTNAQPVGYIEVKEKKAKFVPIVDMVKMVWAGVLIMVPVLMIVGKLLTLKSCKKESVKQ